MNEMLLLQVEDDDIEEAEEEIHGLQDLYQPGQCVVTSVVSIETVNTMTKGEAGCCVGSWVLMYKQHTPPL